MGRTLRGMDTEQGCPTLHVTFSFAGLAACPAFVVGASVPLAAFSCVSV